VDVLALGNKGRHGVRPFSQIKKEFKMMVNKRFALLGLSTALLTGLATLPVLADSAIHGTIKVPYAENTHATPKQQAQESKNLAHMAKLTPKQASTIASRVVKAKVDKIMVENEDGYLVYAVFLGGHEILVDAGNGRVLGNERESVNAND
jgi:uncharacterized membrane protein YkoI